MKLSCLVVVGICAFVACRSQAQVEVDWNSNTGFSPSTVTINTGTEVDFVNMDDTFDLQITGNPPESFSGDAPPTDGINVYYVPYVYNHPGTFTAGDEFGATVTIIVNAVLPLSVAVTDPASNAVFFPPATFSVTAVPAGGATPYLDVQFLVVTNNAGTNDAGDITSSPFTTTVTNLPVGTYTLSAIVTDNNFNTATDSIPVIVAPLPRLSATHTGNKVIVSWPTNYYSGFSLTSATNLPAGTNWTAVALTPALVGTNWVVTNSITGTRQFFRLSNP